MQASGSAREERPEPLAAPAHGPSLDAARRGMTGKGEDKLEISSDRRDWL